MTKEDASPDTVKIKRIIHSENKYLTLKSLTNFNSGCIPCTKKNVNYKVSGVSIFSSYKP